MKKESFNGEGHKDYEMYGERLREGRPRIPPDETIVKISPSSMNQENFHGERHRDNEMNDEGSKQGCQEKSSGMEQTTSSQKEPRNDSLELDTTGALVSNHQSAHLHFGEVGRTLVLAGIPVVGAAVGVLSLIKAIPLLAEVLEIAGIYWALKSQGVPIASTIMSFIRRIQRPSIAPANIVHSPSTPAGERSESPAVRT
mmetsp:Transcript_3542/g.6706  ORF Transcript_3542/g.6706 Transcript_3542/m.6706 type:complete len:199 (-) Transcript_3542:355-951(-)|eukprot:CAMPEP_0184680078 /NCGR_PEP_ID=MMETSP0312-20130426/2944_1 /TAXON_ID=31354 /ORGANISM="Compsopogon coeruleus, Strain SAG 36.94" /LENGTH=198 /DNA_ID=CAMNT_0027129945 /DNA_START=90 /DNA_END=686 /DNA_ORIENTATION=-